MGENNQSIYIDREDAKKIENEERNIFVKTILENLGVPLEEIWEDEDLTVENKLKLRELLYKLDLEIIDDGDRGLKIYNKNILLAEWFKPQFKLRKDIKARNINRSLYYEMIIKTWTIFEEGEL